MSAIRVLIADDQTLLRRLLSRRLANEQDLRIVGEAENGRQAIELADQLRPDVIVMDLNMPILNGAEATERILAQHPEIRVVVLTSFGDLATLGVTAGAYASLDKGCTPEELVSAIRQAFRDSARAAPAGGGGPDYRAAVERLAQRYGLSDRERQVVAKSVTTELTVTQIARALTGELGEAVTESAVKHALDRAMTKMHLDPRTRAALVKRVLETDAARER